MAPPNQRGFEICILAGGLSSRMGQDKARLRLGRLTLLGHVRRAAGKCGQSVRVLRQDAVSRCGPLGGIYTALRSTKFDSVLFLSCDMPFVSPELIHALAGAMDETEAAVFTRSSEMAGFPLIIRASNFALIEEMVQQQQFSLQSLCARLQAKMFSPESGDERGLLNVNTPSEMEEAKEHWRRIAGREDEKVRKPVKRRRDRN